MNSPQENASAVSQDSNLDQMEFVFQGKLLLKLLTVKLLIQKIQISVSSVHTDFSQVETFVQKSQDSVMATTFKLEIVSLVNSASISLVENVSIKIVILLTIL